jgi:hypothetical protein
VTSFGSGNDVFTFSAKSLLLKTLFHLMFLKKKTYLFHEIFAQKDLFDVVVGQDDAKPILWHIDRVLLKRS